VFSGEQDQGERSVRWDGRLEVGSPAPSGAYVVRVRTDSSFGTRKLLLLR